MRRVTVNDIMSARPCDAYPRERIESLFAGRKWITAHGIAEFKIPIHDRLWAVLACFLNDRQRRLFACDCADSALALVQNLDQRSVEAVRVSRLFASGKATSEHRAASKDAARAAALEAAWDVAWAAAFDAAWDAAKDAARAAALEAAWDVAWDAAKDAARAAALEAASAAQLENAVKYATEVK
jgi:hypothetical protein